MRAASTKRSTLTLLLTASFLALGLWFSGSAVVPQLTREWSLSASAGSWMTMSVQLGFVAGALGSALLNLPDRISSERVFAVSSFLGAGCTAVLALWVESAGPALGLRFLTGAALAGVYPPGMKLAASWSKGDRGTSIGLLVGAISLGSGLPHLLNAVLSPDGMPPWRLVLGIGAAGAAVAGLLALVWIRPGPYLGRSAPFDWRFVGRVFSDRPTRLANFGYLGHMWELYAMWTWVPICLLASFEQAGESPALARVAGFAIIAAGSAGSVAAGFLADRWGRTLVAGGSLALSGSCALVAGAFFGSPAALTLVCLVWGFAALADSAQFSAAVSELTDARYVGTALTVQTSMGFLLTVVTIRLVPALLDRLDWAFVFPALALGPVFGVWSMVRLRRCPEAVRMASGAR